MSFQNGKTGGRRFFLFFLFFFCSLIQPIDAAFLGTPKTGLQNLGSEQYPYSIYVPEGYAADRSWPLVIALYVAGGKDQTFVENWAREAERRGFVLLCPGFNIFMQGNPSAHDRRILKLIDEVRAQYEIDPDRVLITGFGDAGHYALYLGLRFPEDIHSVASIGNALEGPLERLFRFAYAEENQFPVLLLVKSTKPAEDSELQEKVEFFRQKGYRVDAVPAESIQDVNDPSAIPFIVNWFDEIGKENRQKQMKHRGGLKQKFFKWLDRVIS